MDARLAYTQEEQKKPKGDNYFKYLCLVRMQIKYLTNINR